ncbi:aminotransferase class I/II-fold pyridoxal phosphate-dependent enzyme [Planomicrobium sp. CPCC 101110]|uniref:aminotransferase class I/II-fold pyridoxal phosphate-dependent enzyme n=1 Tax=Planomicrobium sp. CPCC 101110 TaxID=2599619 RepID=UPI0011B3D302|nr:aminotransferase class I/II-fold pyridoxal phosphate-dependent enzyme [Planomicrobium sp. CPCC 101110]TWT28595.1 aminotransferase class I/II-fold pyridoxal phosphate-dependent enzyme [Planomicrobium sp. CPCC 101110]
MKPKRPLVEALIKFQKQEPISFHVPGHKNGELSMLPQGMRSALAYDFTELTGLDDFHYPQEAIKEAEELLSEVYGTDQSFFLVNGSTVGNLAMVYAVCEEGDVVIVQRNSHKSIFHALELTKVKPVYIMPEWDERSKSAIGIALEDIRTAVAQYPAAKAVILTYPNYYGMAAADMEEVISFCHSQGIPVLVDEAHGAHFQIGSPYPFSALTAGADVVVHSAHKTLPAMTMGSFLHGKGNLVDRKKIKKYLRMLQSSSPSYLIMASLDDARAFVQSYAPEDIRNFEEKRTQFLDSLAAIPRLEVFQSDDPLKVMLRIPGYSGFQLQKCLENVKIYAELTDLYQVMLILPLLKKTQTYPFAEIRSRIKEAVHSALTETPETVSVKMPIKQGKISVPELSFEEIETTDGEWILYTEALGRISAAMVVPYPPGIPLILPGEKWNVAKLEQLMDYLATGAQIQGEHRLAEKLICVVPRQ